MKCYLNIFFTTIVSNGQIHLFHQRRLKHAKSNDSCLLKSKGIVYDGMRFPHDSPSDTTMQPLAEIIACNSSSLLAWASLLCNQRDIKLFRSGLFSIFLKFVHFFPFTKSDRQHLKSCIVTAQAQVFKEGKKGPLFTGCIERPTSICRILVVPKILFHALNLRTCVKTCRIKGPIRDEAGPIS